MKHIKTFESFSVNEAISASDIRDKDKVLNEDPKLAAEIGKFHDLQKEIKKLEEDLMAKKAEFKEFENEIRPMMDCMKEMKVKLSITDKYVIQITRFGGERKDVSYKNAFENALTKVNASTRKVLEAALEASKTVTQVKHSFNIEELTEASILDKIISAIKTGVSKFMNLFKSEEKKIDSANQELEKLAS